MGVFAATPPLSTAPDDYRLAPWLSHLWGPAPLGSYFTLGDLNPFGFISFLGTCTPWVSFIFGNLHRLVLISSLGTCARERRRLAHERVLQRFIQEEEEAEGQAEAAAQLDAREAAEQAEAQRLFDGLAGESPAVGAAGAAGAAESSSGAGGGAGGGLAPI